jgi:hypothetical protein
MRKCLSSIVNGKDTRERNHSDICKLHYVCDQILSDREKRKDRRHTKSPGGHVRMFGYLYSTLIYMMISVDYGYGYFDHYEVGDWICGCSLGCSVDCRHRCRRHPCPNLGACPQTSESGRQRDQTTTPCLACPSLASKAPPSAHATAANLPLPETAETRLPACMRRFDAPDPLHRMIPRSPLSPHRCRRRRVHGCAWSS